MTSNELYILRQLHNKADKTMINHLHKDLENLKNRGLISCLFDEQGDVIIASITPKGRKELNKNL